MLSILFITYTMITGTSSLRYCQVLQRSVVNWPSTVHLHHTWESIQRRRGPLQPPSPGSHQPWEQNRFNRETIWISPLAESPSTLSWFAEILELRTGVIIWVTFSTLHNSTRQLFLYYKISFLKHNWLGQDQILTLKP